ncbi:NADH dehydrogenase [ubiquinone] 1 alpha subcomplex subunit 13 [Diorhabda carinulata]|uniref:NADH dehydrogenase [ubiquinone] 1 alpha subcomplex subunit 13 n=1 Tax=Diorhabda sublineata TaxID=1163346 RepID=UPI0024E09F24|nr:NADH dehydrogenase [ubiquinone] 1 alpha subcomplex subunit 13 [Diorhabda sublineata]XP_057666316.1 NADH dehydrogenase [ubiquinone] 1 alpha subcomplex subunit 13 [Diorhabda carinulata]
MSKVEFKQDMPPPGGYKPIHFKRVPAKTFFGGWAIIGGYLGMTAGAAYLYYLNVKAVKARELEMRCVSLAIYPMLLAERDREFLKQLRRNRDEERELMKNVEGWKVGTWYGEPIYKTKPTDHLVDPMFFDYYVHSSYKDCSTRADIGLLS